MENLTGIFPIPFYVNDIEIKDIELPEFKDTNVVQQEVPELKDKVFEIISEMIQSMGYIDQPLKLNDMWFNRYDDNRPILEYHYHQNCSWTGTYYPVDANHTTVIYNPLANLVQSHYPKVEQPSVFNQELISINDFTKGQIMIHPSWLHNQIKSSGMVVNHHIQFHLMLHMIYLLVIKIMGVILNEDI